jgi:hypothetical protein
MTRTHANRIVLTVLVGIAVLALPGRVGAQTTSTSSSTTSSTSTTSTSTTSTSTTSTSTTSTTLPCPPERCSAAPPGAVLSGSKGQVAGDQGSYCWAGGPGRPAVCRDSVFLDPAAALNVTRGELLTLRFGTEAAPSELMLYRHDQLDGHRQPVFAGTASSLTASNPSTVRADFPEGTFWLVVASKWSQGSSVTFFKVNVKSAAARQPVPLALTG